MMKAVNTLRVRKGRADEVIARFAKPKAVHTFEGFILMEVLKKEDTEDYDELQICVTWRDRSCFEAWRKSRAAEKAHAPIDAQRKNPEENPIISAELTTFEICVQHHPA